MSNIFYKTTTAILTVPLLFGSLFSINSLAQTAEGYLVPAQEMISSDSASEKILGNYAH